MKKRLPILIIGCLLAAAIGWRVVHTPNQTNTPLLPPDGEASTITERVDVIKVVTVGHTSTQSNAEAAADAVTKDTIVQYLNERFPAIQVEVDNTTIPLPDTLFSESDKLSVQYFFPWLEEQYPNIDSTTAVVAITHDDMFIPKTDYALSSVSDHYGVLSDNRLYADDAAASPIGTERVGKLVLRMVGSMIGLQSRHDNEKNCVMLYTPTIADLDAKGFDWCGDEQSTIDAVYPTN